MRLARRLLAVLVFTGLLVGGWLFADNNSQLVRVYHPAGEIGEVKLWLALLISFASGLGIAAAVGLVRGARLRLIARRYRKIITGLQGEVHQLRNLPLSDQDPAGEESSETRSGLERGS
jgi:uncharacterized integral membrane protein